MATASSLHEADCPFFFCIADPSLHRTDPDPNKISKPDPDLDSTIFRKPDPDTTSFPKPDSDPTKRPGS